jgi:adenosylcobinamide-GDP ribazoletransferase
VKIFLLALQFLTTFPVRIKAGPSEKDFGASLAYFPLVGLLLGLLLSGCVFLFSFLPDAVRAALILLVSIIITGGIHLDGFADTCDAFYGNKPKEKILEIMRDSHIGVMAVIGLCVLLFLKFSLLVSIPTGYLGKLLILTPIFSRYCQVIACVSCGYARNDGKAKYFVEYAGKKEFLIATIFTVFFSLLLMKLKGAILLTLCLFFAFLFIMRIKRRIGGMTGDTIGAVSEIAEVLVLLFGLVLI